MNTKITPIGTIDSDSATAEKSIQSKPNSPTYQGGKKKKQITEANKRCLPKKIGLTSNKLMLSILLLLLVVSLTLDASLSRCASFD